MTTEEYRMLASYLVERHGVHAQWFIAQRAHELSEQGDTERARNLETVCVFIEELIAGRIPTEVSTAIH